MCDYELFLDCILRSVYEEPCYTLSRIFLANKNVNVHRYYTEKEVKPFKCL